MRIALVAAITTLTTAALVGTATVAGATMARPSTAALGRAAAGPRSAAGFDASQPEKAGQEQFRILSTVAGARRQSSLATGTFTAGGYLAPGKIVNLRSTDRMVFPNGSFQMARHITSQWLPLPTAACLVRETLRGRYTIGHGTGAYRRLSGSGSFVLRIRGVIRRSHGKCGGSMTVFQQVINASGPVRGY